jgi:flagellar hook-basal body complex protein FliE
MIENIGTIAKSGLAQTSVVVREPHGLLESAKNFATHLAETIQAGEQAAISGVNGTMSMNDVVQKVMEAERSLTTLVSVRDKAVSSLLELTRMQV